VYNIDDQKYLSLYDVIEIIKSLGLDLVPTLYNDFVLDHSVDQLVELAKGKSIYNNKTHREGIVVRPVEEIEDQSFGKLHVSRVSFKTINPDFLLKYDE
jgi:hypothetical protein